MAPEMVTREVEVTTKADVSANYVYITFTLSQDDNVTSGALTRYQRT